jgi:hypothetical protein
MPPTDAHIDAFLARWVGASGGELANYQLFLTELAELLELPRPDPAAAEREANAYVFERQVTFRFGDGGSGDGRIDLYRRGAFVCEAKKVRAETATRRFDDAMLRARAQAEAYARALPTEEGRPPFLIVVDVGRVIELYAEFSRSGATYTPFPDPRSHRIAIERLREPEIRERLRAVWLDPLSLDPTRRSARVTREIAARLAELARSLEAAGHDAEAVAAFLSRCLFTCFAEDIGLLPKDGFRHLLERHAREPAIAMRMLEGLWREMDSGGFSVALAAPVLRFNGKLFKHADTLPLDAAQLALLIESARAEWSQVEPAIFGTLLERALDPAERHALGAHYTPRAYVERLVLPTVIEPLRRDWSDAKAAAIVLANEGDTAAALDTVRDFHRSLCRVRVLDPACGSGNFLYVTLEHLKRLEGEVLNTFDELDPSRQDASRRQQGLALDGPRADPFGGETVDPHQLLGIELNPRAAAIAEMVLWIGYLQWHYRTRGDVNPPEPVLRDFRNIECRDAVLAFDRVEYLSDDAGRPQTRWDGKTMKPSPVTGEPVPDESARVPIERYINPRAATWPEAEFVVGNPPFIGNKRMRLALGDGYVEALRAAWPDVPDSADFVMYWWDRAAELTRAGKLRRFGLITTNSLTMVFNRRIVERAMRPPAKDEAGAVSLAFAIPDHPWVDSTDGAAVRIAMTVGARDANETARLLTVERETPGGDQDVTVALAERLGEIQASLRVGAPVSTARKLRSNASLSSMGVMRAGAAFLIPHGDARLLGVGRVHGIDAHVRPFRSGRDLIDTPRALLAIDLFGLGEEEVRTKFPEVYQWLLTRVKPERDQNNRERLRREWWIFAEPRQGLRLALGGVGRYAATVETAKHRFFVHLSTDVLPDHKLVAIALEDASALGVLSSRLHVAWALAAGGRLGVGNDAVYSKTTCFDPFPFPILDETQRARIGELAEAIDGHRKRQQAAFPGLTLTGIYNVLEALRRGDPLSARERLVHEQGLVSVLRELHDALDRAVFEAYGWADLAERLVGRPGATTPWPEKPAEQAEAEEELLSRLVALNAERAAEEARGLVRWRRPDFQARAAGKVDEAAAVDADDDSPDASPPTQGTLIDADTDAASPAPMPADANPPARGRKPGKARKSASMASTDIDAPGPADPGAPRERIAWPKAAPEQARAVAEVLTRARGPLALDAIAAHFTGRGRWRDRLPELLDTLTALGRAHRIADTWRAG